MQTLIPCNLLLPSKGSERQLKFMSKWVLLADAEDYIGLGSLVDDDTGRVWHLQDGRTLPFEAVTQWITLSSVDTHTRKFAGAELVDADGYPSAYSLNLLKTWPWHDPEGWFRLALQLWQFKTTHAHVEASDRHTTYFLSTAGWSGNESMIRAMQANEMLWHSTWVSSKRGGHFEFKLETEDPPEESTSTSSAIS